MIKKSEVVFNYCKIVLFAILLAVDYIIFVVPNKFAPAGVGGIATMIEHTTGFSIGFFTLIVNVPLCVFAFFKISRDFAIKSFVFTVVYSLAYLLLQLLFSKYDLKGLQYDANGVDTIFPCLIAGMISGFVYGLSFRINSSTGGFDIISIFVSKKNPTLNFFWVSFFINAIVAFVSLFVYGTNGEGLILDYKPVCLCMLYIFMSNFIGNQMLKGYSVAYKFTIITTHADEIGAEIVKTLKHSATKIEGKGIYSEDGKQVLMCVVNKHQVVDFKKILLKYGETFTFVETVNETVGNFKKIK